MLSSGNETANASQLLQARAEQIRMANWLDVTAANYLPGNLLAGDQPLVADNLSALTETVSVGNYQYNPNGAAAQVTPSYIYQRAPDRTITRLGGSNAVLGSSDCVQFIITEHWSSWGGRPRERTLTTLASTWGIGQR